MTEKGEREYLRILELLHMYINKIKTEGVKQFIFDEKKRLNEIAFDNITKSSAMSYANNMCSRLSRIPEEEEMPDILWRPYALERFDADEILKRLEMLQPHRAIVMYITKSVNAEGL